MRKNTIIIPTETNFQFYFDSETLGNNYSLSLNGHIYRLHFPDYKDSERGIGYLAAPKGYNFSFDYGYKWESNTNRVSIEAIVIEAEGSNENTDDELIERLELAVNGLLHDFNLWGVVLSGQLFLNNQITEQYGKAFYRGNEYIPISIGPAITCYLHDNYYLPKSNDVKKILRKIETNESFPLELEYYKNAILDFNSSNFNRAALDSATAAEIVLNRLIFNKLTARTKKEKDIILKQVNGINQLKRFAKSLKIVIPKEIDFQKIAWPRNKAIHEGITIAQKQAEESLIETRKLLEENKYFA